MSYPEDLNTSKNIQDLLFKKEFAQLHLNKSIFQKIHTKKEQSLEDILSPPDKNGILHKINDLILDPLILKENLLVLHSHQHFVKNLINPDTPYTRLLLKHQTGTGKTIAALSIAFTFIKHYQLQYSLVENTDYSYTPLVYVIGFSKQIFQKELLRRPEFGFITKEEIIEHKRLKYLADVGSQNDKDNFAEFESRIKKRLSRKNRGGFFKFFGYKEFFNRLFIFSKEYLKYIQTPERSTDESITEERAPILTEDQIINGLKSGLVSINYDLIDSFANSFIICDEIHNVYNSSEINNYGIAIRILLNIYDIPEIMNKIIKLEGFTAQGQDRMRILKNAFLKTIFMSATPVNNSPTEIIDLLNLLIPLSKLPNQKKLEKEDFFEDMRNLKKNALEKIQDIVQGYISFLRDDNPKYFPERKFDGEEIIIPDNYLKDRVSFYKGKNIPYLKFIKCPMSEFHQKTYDAIYTGTLPPDGQSLIDLVLPNPGLIEGEKNIGLFRTKDIKYSLANAPSEWKDKNQISLDKVAETNVYMITGEFMKHKTLKIYSAKYSTMLDMLYLNLQNDEGKIIISHQHVRMSGVLFIQEVLRRNGWIDEYANPTDETLCSKCGNIRSEHFNPKATFLKKSPHEFMPARFIIFHGDIDRPTLDKSLERFKSPENMDGYQYRVLIGSKIINEGIDFNAVRNVWIMVAPANIPTLIQILGRAIRNNSHAGLPPEKRNVRIKIFVSTIGAKGRKNKELSYEEKKYFEKSQDYLVIQQIEKVFNQNAIDAVIHRNVIMPPEQIEEFKKTKEESLGALYFEPSGIFGKKWIDISKGLDKLTMNDVSLTTFKIYHSDEEINRIIYIIKRLFIEQSTVWTYDDLWYAVKNPPFDIHVNPELFLEDNFMIALNLLSESLPSSAGSLVDTYQITTYGDLFEKNMHYNVSRLFDNLDKEIVLTNNKKCKILYVNGYYMLFPVINVLDQDIDTIELDTSVSNVEKTPSSYLGISSNNLSGIPDIDIDNWHRQSEDIENTSIRITKYLKTSNVSYNQMKFKFYNQFKDYAVEDLPVSVEVYDLDFHSKLVEDSIRYTFNILTNPTMPFSELHEFYFKMLYFYNRLDLILFADHLEGTKLIEIYKDYITHSNLEIDVYEDIKDKKTKKAKEILIEQHKYNPFLMSSIIKSSETRTFNMDRLNNFLGRRPDIPAKKRHPKLEDMNIDKQLNMHRKTIRKVFSNMLPVGHFLNTSMEGGSILAVPKIYIPNLDPDIIDVSKLKTVLEPKVSPWTRAYDFVRYHEATNLAENDIIIGYYEKNPSGIDIKFKLRPPIQKITMYEDTRMIERGSVCNTRKKDELIKIADDLKLNLKELMKKDSSIKTICNEIKLELMHREMAERRKVKHMSEQERKEYKQVKWFYTHFEQQLEY